MDIRKIRKPLMEKKRRARINDSLEILKDIIIRNAGLFPAHGSRPTKLEKADILELTVQYVRLLQKKLAATDDGVTSTTSDGAEKENHPPKSAFRRIDPNIPVNSQHWRPWR